MDSRIRQLVRYVEIKQNINLLELFKEKTYEIYKCIGIIY